MHFKVIQWWYFLLTELLFVSVTSAYDLCYSDDTYSYYCDSPYTCCYSNTQCCNGSSRVDSSSASTSGLTTGAIAGIVIGCIILVCIVVTIIFLCIKQSGHSGCDIQPLEQTTAQAYQQPTENYTLTSRQCLSNSAMEGQDGSYYQPDDPAVSPNLPNNRSTTNQNQNSGDQVPGAIRTTPDGLYGSDEYRAPEGLCGSDEYRAPEGLCGSDEYN